MGHYTVPTSGFTKGYYSTFTILKVLPLLRKPLSEVIMFFRDYVPQYKLLKPLSPGGDIIMVRGEDAPYSYRPCSYRPRAAIVHTAITINPQSDYSFLLSLSSCNSISPSHSAQRRTISCKKILTLYRQSRFLSIRSSLLL